MTTSISLRGLKIGAAAGFVLALVMTLCAIAGLGEVTPVKVILRFLGGPPAYLAWQIGRLEWLAWVFLFLYWGVVGAGFGVLLGHSLRRQLIFVICFFVILVVIHRATQVYMDSEVELIALGLKE